MVSMVAHRPVDAHILTAARGAMQGRSRPPLADLRASFVPSLRSSLPGSTRQSISFAKNFLRRRMDPRVKPGGDAASTAKSDQSESVLGGDKARPARGA